MGEAGRLSARLVNNISGKRSACQGRRHSRRSSERRVSGAETLDVRQGRRHSRRSSERRVSGAKTLDVRAGFCYSGILSGKKMTNWA